MLNGQYLNVRGVGLHEDSKAQGFAIDNARRRQLVTDAKELGATVLRTHYPLHPYTHELADREGRAALRRARERFDLQAMLEAVAALYAELLHARGVQAL